MNMPVSETPIVERIARVLSGQRFSVNANGTLESAGDEVDRDWRNHVDDALAVLHTLREPDRTMAAAGDPAVWDGMVEAALKSQGR